MLNNPVRRSKREAGNVVPVASTIDGSTGAEMSGAVFEDEKVRGRMDGRSLFTIYSLALAPPLGLRHGERPP